MMNHEELYDKHVSNMEPDEISALLGLIKEHHPNKYDEHVDFQNHVEQLDSKYLLETYIDADDVADVIGIDILVAETKINNLAYLLAMNHPDEGEELLEELLYWREAGRI